MQTSATVIAVAVLLGGCPRTTTAVGPPERNVLRTIINTDVPNQSDNGRIGPEDDTFDAGEDELVAGSENSPTIETVDRCSRTESEIVTPGDSPDETREYQCTSQDISVEGHPSDIFMLAVGSESIVPGMVLSGNRTLLQGVATAIPLPRTSASLVVDLPVATPVRHVLRASRASLGRAVADFQSEASGLEASLPTRLMVQVEEARSFEEARLRVGVSASFASPMVRAGMQADFVRSREAREHSVVVRLYQPMYTVAFSDDLLTRNNDFFADEAFEYCREDPRCLRGYASDDDRPIFVSSVTYGRMIVFTATSRHFASSTELRLRFEAAFRGVSASGSVGASADVFRTEVLDRSVVRLLALGGSQATAFAALRSGDFREFFSAQNAGTAVPLAFRANFLAPGRPLASLRMNTRVPDTACRRTDCGDPPADIKRVHQSTERRDKGIAGGRWLHVVGPAECPENRTRHHYDVNIVRGSRGSCASVQWHSPGTPTDCRVEVQVRVNGGFPMGRRHTSCLVEIFAAAPGTHSERECRHPTPLHPPLTEQELAACRAEGAIASEDAPTQDPGPEHDDPPAEEDGSE